MKKESFYVCEECGAILRENSYGYLINGTITLVSGSNENRKILDGEFSLCKTCFLKRLGVAQVITRG